MSLTVENFFSENKFLAFPIIVFILLYLPFINAIPYLDGNIDFVKAYDFYTGGFEGYFKNWPSVHPPFKILTTSLAFGLFGIKPLAYNLIGLVFGIIGIVAIYHLSKNLLDKRTANISSFLLASSPLYISVGIFSLIDYLLTTLILVALLFYCQKRYTLYFFFASLGVMTKETGLILPLSVISIELIYFLKGRGIKSVPKRSINQFLSFLLPLTVFYLWKRFIAFHGQREWSDWIFTETKDKGAFYTVVNNLIRFKFLNKFTYQQWLQLLVLNFNWVFWLISITGTTTYFLSSKASLRKIMKQILKGDLRAKTALVITVFFIAYFFSVLTFQTYTIPRYALPLIPFLLIMTALSINNIVNFLRLGNTVVFTLLILMTSLMLFTSIDPLSIKLWGKTEILGQKIYALNHTLAGNDGITYNMQYLFISQERSRSILKNNNYPNGADRNVLGLKAFRSQPDCYWLFPDVNNERKTIKILKIEGLPIVKNCIKL